MAKKISAKGEFEPKSKTKRRRKPRPFNHKKSLSKRSPFSGMRKKNRGQG